MRAARTAMIVAMTLMSGCAASATSPTGQVQPASAAPWFTTLRSQTTSWGATVHWWTLNPDGSGESAEVKEPRRSFPDFDMEVRRIQLTTEQVQRIATLIAEMRQQDFKCDFAMTDAPTMTIRWTSVAGDGQMETYGGCTPARSAARYDRLREMSLIITDAAHGQPVERIVPRAR
jgi:hypothetical protein